MTIGPSKSASRIFISYRRKGSAYAVGRLAHDLRQNFSRDDVFEDLGSIEPGADFAQALQHALDACVAVLVVIDPGWLTVTDKQGRRRLDLPDDWVRQEVIESLRRPGVRVIPLLLDADMPGAEQLPEPLQPLARRQAFPLTARHWPEDVAKLVGVLRGLDESIPAALDAGSPLSTVDDSASVEASGGRSKRGAPASRSRMGRWAVGAALVAVIAIALVAAGLSDRLPWARAIAVHGPQPLYLPFKTGDVFRECAECPEMVVIAAYPTPLPDALPDDQKIAPFAIGKFEVTRGQFGASGIKPSIGCYPSTRTGLDKSLGSQNPGFEQGMDHPVACLDRSDIHSYLGWLNQRTGQQLAYRLPRLSEWDLAARGGASGRQHWGTDDHRSCEYANVFDRTAAQARGVAFNYDCIDGYAYTAPVGRFKPNAFGVYDTIGNAWEWLEDCGRTVGRRDCSVHIATGGSWARDVVDDYRRHYEEASDSPRDSLGFRVVRTLEQR